MSWSADEIKRQAARDVAREQAAKRDAARPPAAQSAQRPIPDDVAPEDVPAYLAGSSVDPYSSLSALVMDIAARDRFTLEHHIREVELARLPRDTRTGKPPTWAQFRYAAGLSASERIRRKLGPDDNLLQSRRVAGRGRNACGVWSPAKWRTFRGGARQTCLDCKMSKWVSTMKFRKGLCRACYLRAWRKTP